MTSLHANSAWDCLSRMETLFLMAGFEIPINVVRKQIASSVNFIIQLGRSNDGSRVVMEIMEVCGMEGATILTQQIATREDGFLVFKGIPPKEMDQLHRQAGMAYNFFENMN